MTSYPHVQGEAMIKELSHWFLPSGRVCSDTVTLQVEVLNYHIIIIEVNAV